MSLISRTREGAGRPAPRILDSGQILRDEVEICIQHGPRQYMLRATRSGRLTMSGNWRAFPLIWLSLPFLLIAAYLAGAPFVCGSIMTYVPSLTPLLEIVYAPAQLVYDTFSSYEGYCDWIAGLFGLD